MGFFYTPLVLTLIHFQLGWQWFQKSVESLHVYVQPILVLDIVHDVIFYLFHIHSKIIGFVFEPVKQLWDLKCIYKCITLFKMTQI